MCSLTCPDELAHAHLFPSNQTGTTRRRRVKKNFRNAFNSTNRHQSRRHRICSTSGLRCRSNTWKGHMCTNRPLKRIHSRRRTQSTYYFSPIMLNFTGLKRYAAHFAIGAFRKSLNGWSVFREIKDCREAHPVFAIPFSSFTAVGGWIEDSRSLFTFHASKCR